eukprot:666425-Prorocentrum_minimum.AAC.1
MARVGLGGRIGRAPPPSVVPPLQSRGPSDRLALAALLVGMGGGEPQPHCGGVDLYVTLIRLGQQGLNKNK